MTERNLIIARAALLCVAGAQIAVSQDVDLLSSSDILLQLKAAARAPRLIEWSTPGQPPWKNNTPEALIDHVLTSSGKTSVQWTLNAGASRKERTRVSYIYESASPHLRLSWEWHSRAGFGPVEHRIVIENLDSRELWLPFQDSFTINLEVPPRVALELWSIEKGAGTPSQVGTHRDALNDGYNWIGTSGTYANPEDGAPREVIPWMLVQEAAEPHGGWYTGIEFSGRTRLEVRRARDTLTGNAGLNPSPGPFYTRLAPGESFETPTVFLGAYQGGTDVAGNVLRRWVRQVLNSAATWKNPAYPLTVNNSWGGGMDVDAGLARRMIRDAAELGLEMFHVDAGWFRGVGDWYPDPKKFPEGLAAVSEEAHRHGMKFGLWVDWTQAGLSPSAGALNARDPAVRDWMVTALPLDWRPEPFKGHTIDIGVPAAHDWALAEVERIVSDYHLDMLEHDGYLVAEGCERDDHPHAPPDPAHTTVHKWASSFWVESTNSTDVSYHAVRSYYDIYEKLRERHPGILLEACNDGGRMVDFGTAAHTDYFSVTDTYDPLSNRRAFYDASFVLPAAMLESYVEKWPTPNMDNFQYMLRSGMMGWLTLMVDTNAWSAEQHATAKRQIELYKTRLRPLIRDAGLYHISARPDGVHWDGIQYFDPRRKTGVVYAFRGSIPDAPEHEFVLHGLKPGATYQVHYYDGTLPDRTASGRELASSGLRVKLTLPNSSELVFLEETAAARE